MFAAEDSGHYTSRVMQDSWETVSSERHFANAHLEVVTDHVRTPSRSLPRSWTIVHRKAAVIVAPMTRDGKIILIRQERIPIRAAIWEMPSGQIDGPAQETVEQVALRELGNSSRSAITLPHRVSQTNAATSFWRAQWNRARIMCVMNRNRFWIAAPSLSLKFAE